MDTSDWKSGHANQGGNFNVVREPAPGNKAKWLIFEASQTTVQDFASKMFTNPLGAFEGDLAYEHLPTDWDCILFVDENNVPEVQATFAAEIEAGSVIVYHGIAGQVAAHLAMSESRDAFRKKIKHISPPSAQSRLPVVSTPLEAVPSTDQSEPEPEPEEQTGDARPIYDAHRQANGNGRVLEPLSQHRVAEEFERRNSPHVRYDCHSTKWYVWRDGEGWRGRTNNHILHQCHEIAVEMSACAKARSKEKLQSAAFAKGVADVASWKPGIALEDPGIWDADPMLLGLPDGLVCDLSTGEVRTAQPEDMITKRTGAIPADDEECPVFKAFIQQVTMGDTEYVAYIKRALGYAITGRTSEQVLFFLYGPGGNGKGVLASIVQGAMGEYAMPAPPKMFISGGFADHPTEVAGLQGARLVVASEVGANDKWNEARIKLLSGGDRINARFMRKDYFSFDPQFQIMILGNNRPAFAEVDDAIRRRMQIWPFKFKPKDGAKDIKLPEKLDAESPGILRWLINGCLAWQREGLCPPPIIAQATEEYLAEQDLFAEFIEEECHCEPGNHGLREAAKHLYATWKSFCEQRGEFSGSQKAFGDRLRKHGLGKSTPSKINGKSIRFWLGIQLQRGSYHDDPGTAE